ncbi:MAG TPA: FxSxx-COOH system tetratricopeptide repeat protein [Candidatus Binatia bacterium]|nr:FxSxx-COOH system tetratricopeptide repeat protein [Candidatus Binatia bacterium]
MSENSAQALFLSRTGADADVAAVVGEILGEAGYAVLVTDVHSALAEGARVVALLSPDYLRSDRCQAEWQNAIARDPLNIKSRLILLRVAECEPPGLLSGLAYWDIVPVRDNRPLLRDIVLDSVREERRESAPAGPYWRAPRTIVDGEAIRPVSSFSGREAELTALERALTRDRGIAALCGLGGLGKSSLAREYAWRNRDAYSVIWWLNAQTEDALVEGLLRLGAIFVRGLDRHADRRAAAHQVVRTVLGSLSKPALLIFDNLEDERILRAWRPRAGACVLVTSRNTSWSADVTPIALNVWPLDVAAEFVRSESARADLTGDDARAIAETLGGLPLALAHAAAALRGRRMVSAQRYLQRVNDYLKNAPQHSEYPQSVFATFSTAIAQAEHEVAGAADLLCFAAAFAPDAIPSELFEQPADRYPHALQPLVTDELRRNEALGVLDRLSLLAYAPASQSHSIHRLVQLAARDVASSEGGAWTRYAAAAAELALPEPTLETWPHCERLLPHARAALSALGDDAFLPAARLSLRCGIYLRQRGEYGGAEALLLPALTTLERLLGPQNADVAAALHELAIVYTHEGRHAEAEPLITSALAIREAVLGPEHRAVATTLSDIATVCHRLGRYEEEEPLYLRALAIQERLLGTDHPEVAATVSDLAYFYDWRGRYAESERLQLRALAIREKALGPDHPDVALSLNNLGKIYYRQERYEEVVLLIERALAIMEKAVGTNHPDVGHVLNNLALLHLRLGRYEEARTLLERALRLREKALGLDHQDVAVALNSLAQVNEAQARFEEAEALRTRDVRIREKVYGLDHAEVAAAVSDLAALYEAQQRFKEAESLYARTLSIRERTLGPDHPNLIAARKSIANLRARVAYRSST